MNSERSATVITEPVRATAGVGSSLFPPLSNEHEDGPIKPSFLAQNRGLAHGAFLGR